MTQIRQVKQIPGFEGYCCSEDGVIYRCVPIKVYYTFKEAPFYPPRMEDEPVVKDTGCPYKMVRMNNELKYVHRIIAKTWVNNPRPDIFDRIDHIDKNEINNNLNLRWSNSSLNALNTDALNCYFIKKMKNGSRWYTVNKWLARVCISGKVHSLGMYKTFLEGFRVARKFREENLARIYKELCDEAPRPRDYLFLE